MSAQGLRINFTYVYLLSCGLFSVYAANYSVHGLFLFEINQLSKKNLLHSFCITPPYLRHIIITSFCEITNKFHTCLLKPLTFNKGWGKIKSHKLVRSGYVLCKPILMSLYKDSKVISLINSDTIAVLLAKRCCNALCRFRHIRSRLFGFSIYLRLD